MSGLTVCYNGACPICRAEIDHYRKHAPDAAGLTFLDVAAEPARAAGLGLVGDRPLRRLHTVDADGRITGGVAAFAKIWNRLPSHRWLAGLVGLPILRGLADLAYERVAAPLLFRRHLRRQARSRSGGG